MRNRKNILHDLVSLKGNLADLVKELNNFSWDTDEPIVIITAANLLFILEMCLNGTISYEQLEDWANTIECRDDVDFENDRIQQIIIELANPEINEKISNQILLRLINSLK